MYEEITALRKKNTFDEGPISKRRKLINSKWVYKEKIVADGTLKRQKARGFAKGLFQIPETDFGEIYAAVGRYEFL